jgi:polyisoprenoid-binding protein YceI
MRRLDIMIGRQAVVPLVAFALCSLFGMTVPDPPQEIVLKLNANKATVTYNLGAFMHTVNGTFKVESGIITYNSRTSDASGRVVIDLRTGQSGDKARDDNMQNAVLQTQTYPTAMFTPTHVTGQINPSGASDLSVDGTLNVHGTNHSITVPLQLLSTNGIVTAQAKYRVPFVAWGMRDPSTFILRVRNYVDVVVTGPATISTPSDSGSR